MHAPPSLTSHRLTFHRPKAEDAEAIFSRYASVRRYASAPEVTRDLVRPRHNPR